MKAKKVNIYTGIYTNYPYIGLNRDRHFSYNEAQASVFDQRQAGA
jgi:hypothetical protein